MTRHILIVDDDDDARDILTLTLEALELPIIKATDGEEALRYVKEHTPILIFLDLQMPNVDGYEVLRQIKKMPMMQSIPVIVFSAHPTSELYEFVPKERVIRKGSTSMTYVRKIVINLIKDHLDVNLSLL